MSAISENCNRDHDIWELFNTLPNSLFTTSEAERDYQ